MNDHVRDRLSALLDRELGEAEREAVESHLAACAACARDLDLLRAVDAEARALPVDAPAGYFEALPGRVRARLEGATRRRFAPPVWTWAVAAALLLAVITPIAMRQRPTLTGDHREPRQVAAPPVASPAAPATEEQKQVERREMTSPVAAGGEGTAAVLKLQPEKARKDELAAPGVATKPERDHGGPTELAKAKPDAAASRIVERAHEAGAPATARAQGPGGPSAQTQAPLQAQAAPAPPFAAPPEAEAKATDNVAEAVTVEATRGAAPARPSNAVGALADKPERPRAGRVERSFAAAEESLFRRLTGPVPHTLDALRARREEWRSYAQEFATGPHADEARVRLVESGAEAWRVGGDSADLARARDDAAAYLARGDAAQAPRVRAMLESLPEKP